VRVTVKSVIHRPPETLFWLSQDYERRLEWDVYLDEAHLLHGKTHPAVGVESFCRNKSGSVLVSRYISFSPPKHAAVQMTSGPSILESFSGTWRFRSVGEGCSEVKFVYSFQCRPRLLRWILDPFAAAVYKFDMRRRLQAFKVWAEAEPQA
jgi:hypothetical protein